MQSKFYTCSILIWAISLLAACDRAEEVEIVHIPDIYFQNALIANGVDCDEDGQISFREAEATEILLIPPSGITDVTGLEAFIQLDSLTITLNPLNKLDLSSNKTLRYLECSSCEISSLNISANARLEELICGRNKLTELELTNNLALQKLACNNNLLTNLDLSNNRGLTKMISCGNQLGRLDISNQPHLELIGVDNMPMLTELCVWTLPFPPEGIVVLKTYSPNIEFTTTCSR